MNRICENCRHQTPDRSHSGWHECDKTAFWVSLVDDESGARIEFGCNLFEKKEHEPFSVERTYCLPPAPHILGIVARFPGHAPHRMANLNREGMERMCAWLNERWAERGNDD